MVVCECMLWWCVSACCGVLVSIVVLCVSGCGVLEMHITIGCECGGYVSVTDVRV